jgi:hypothetical protein
MRRTMLVLLVFALPEGVWAGTITGIVSERSAAGARALLDEVPEHGVRLRSSGQLARFSDLDVINPEADADGVFLPGGMDDSEHNGLRLRPALNGLPASVPMRLPKRPLPVLACHRAPATAGSSGARTETAMVYAGSGYAGGHPTYRSAGTPFAEART